MFESGQAISSSLCVGLLFPSLLLGHQHRKSLCRGVTSTWSLFSLRFLLKYSLEDEEARGSLPGQTLDIAWSDPCMHAGHGFIVGSTTVSWSSNIPRLDHYFTDISPRVQFGLVALWLKFSKHSEFSWLVATKVTSLAAVLHLRHSKDQAILLRWILKCTIWTSRHMIEIKLGRALSFGWLNLWILKSHKSGDRQIFETFQGLVCTVNELHLYVCLV
jgi:hypothetical protein